MDRTTIFDQKFPKFGKFLGKQVSVLLKSSKWKTIHTYQLSYVEICHKIHAYCIFRVFLIIFENASTAPKSDRLSIVYREKIPISTQKISSNTL